MRDLCIIYVDARSTSCLLLWMRQAGNQGLYVQTQVACKQSKCYVWSSGSRTINERITFRADTICVKSPWFPLIELRVTLEARRSYNVRSSTLEGIARSLSHPSTHSGVYMAMMAFFSVASYRVAALNARIYFYGTEEYGWIYNLKLMNSNQTRCPR